MTDVLANLCFYLWAASGGTVRGSAGEGNRSGAGIDPDVASEVSEKLGGLTRSHFCVYTRISLSFWPAVLDGPTAPPSGGCSRPPGAADFFCLRR